MKNNSISAALVTMLMAFKKVGKIEITPSRRFVFFSVWQENYCVSIVFEKRTLSHVFTVKKNGLTVARFANIESFEIYVSLIEPD